MMPMTPSGTETRAILRPLGRSHSASIAADRIGQGGDLLQALGHGLDALARPASAGRARRRSGPWPWRRPCPAALAARMSAPRARRFRRHRHQARWSLAARSASASVRRRPCARRGRGRAWRTGRDRQVLGGAFTTFMTAPDRRGGSSHHGRDSRASRRFRGFCGP